MMLRAELPVQRNRTLRMSDGGPVSNGGRVLRPGSFQQHRALRFVPRHPSGAPEFRTGVVSPAKFVEQVASNGGKQIVVREQGLAGNLVERVESSLGSERHSRSDGVIQRDDW